MVDIKLDVVVHPVPGVDRPINALATGLDDLLLHQRG